MIRNPARSTLHILIAVFVLGLTVLVNPSPAVADCGNLTLFGLKDNGLDSKVPPEPALPDSGVSGMFNSPGGDGGNLGVLLTSESKGNKISPITRYDRYSYAGYSFNTYDLGCGGDLRDPVAAFTTGFGSLLLTSATAVIGMTNSMREWAYDPGTAWQWSDGFVRTVNQQMNQHLFTPWGTVALIAVGLYMLWTTKRGDWSTVALTAGWALFVMVLTSAAVMYPDRATDAADEVMKTAVNTLYYGTTDAKALQDRREGRDLRTASDRASAQTTQVYLYEPWLEGTFGSSTSATALTYGDQLYRQTVLDWKEAETVAADSKNYEGIAERKKAEFIRIAEEVHKKDPVAYEHLKGTNGWNRVWVGLVALLSALMAVPFDLAASFMMVLGFLVVRISVAFLPAVATVAIFRPAAAPLRRMLSVLVAALINVLFFTAGSIGFMTAVTYINGQDLPRWQRLALVALSGLVLWLLIRPYRRFTQFVRHSPLRVAGDALKRTGRFAENVAAHRIANKRSGQHGDGDGQQRPEDWSRPLVVSVDVAVNVNSGRSNLSGEDILDGEVVDAEVIGERPALTAGKPFNSATKPGLPEPRRTMVPANVVNAEDEPSNVMFRPTGSGTGMIIRGTTPQSEVIVRLSEYDDSAVGSDPDRSTWEVWLPPGDESGSAGALSRSNSR